MYLLIDTGHSVTLSYGLYMQDEKWEDIEYNSSEAGLPACKGQQSGGVRPIGGET